MQGFVGLQNLDHVTHIGHQLDLQAVAILQGHLQKFAQDALSLAATPWHDQ